MSARDETPTSAADWHRVLLGTMRRMDCQDLFDDAAYQLGALLNFTKKEAAGLPDVSTLREAAQRLCDAIADHAAITGLGLGWKAEMDADDARLCALQDTRTALDGRERPHRHVALGGTPL